MSDQQLPIDKTLGALAGIRVAGGCDHCDAYQVMEGSDGMYVMHTCHDDWCPWYRERTK